MSASAKASDDTCNVTCSVTRDGISDVTSNVTSDVISRITQSARGHALRVQASGDIITDNVTDDAMMKSSLVCRVTLE